MRIALCVAVFVLAVSVLTGVAAASTILVTVTLNATVTILPSSGTEDVDGDGCVGPQDLAIVGRSIDSDSPPAQGADVNKDGQVDVRDLASVALLFGTRTFGSQPCP